MQRLYETKMCGFFRRYFSLKSLRAFRVLAVSCFLDQLLVASYRQKNKLIKAWKLHSTRQLQGLW